MKQSRWNVIKKIHLTWDFLRYLIRRFEKDQCRRHSAALTFTTLFAVVPMMTVTYSMLSAVPQLQGAGDQIQNFIFQHFVPSTSDILRTYLLDFTTQARKLTGVGVVFLLVTAFMMIVTIEGAFNTIWRVNQHRSGVSSFLLYWAILSLGPLLIGFGFIVSSYLISLPLLNDPSFDLGVKQYFLGAVPTLLSVMAFTLLYVAVPNHRVPLRHGLVGGIVVALLFEMAKYCFALFVKAFPSYQFIYGAFAVVPLFLSWIYVSWVIILMGAQLVRSLSTYEPPERSAKQHHEMMLMLQTLELLWRQHNNGQGALFREREILRSLNMKDTERWRKVKEYLLSNNIIHRTDHQCLSLSRSLHHLTLWEVISQSPWFHTCHDQLMGFLISL